MGEEDAIQACALPVLNCCVMVCCVYLEIHSWTCTGTI